MTLNFAVSRSIVAQNRNLTVQSAFANHTCNAIRATTRKTLSAKGCADPLSWSRRHTSVSFVKHSQQYLQPRRPTGYKVCFSLRCTVSIAVAQTGCRRLHLHSVVCRHRVRAGGSDHRMADDEDKPEPGEDQPQMSITEQLKTQTELAREDVFKRTAAPPGKSSQILVVMRHGERIDEVQI